MLAAALVELPYEGAQMSLPGALRPRLAPWLAVGGGLLGQRLIPARLLDRGSQRGSS